MLITRRLEFDAGHRIPDHKSQCRHLHDRAFSDLVAELDFELFDHAGVAGGDLHRRLVKDLANLHLVNEWDHAFLAYAGDKAVVDFLASMPGHKTVILDRVPTAENLARIAFERLDAVYRDTYGNHLHLEQVRLYETPNCWADALRTRLD